MTVTGGSPLGWLVLLLSFAFLGGVAYFVWGRHFRAAGRSWPTTIVLCVLLILVFATVYAAGSRR